MKLRVGPGSCTVAKEFKEDIKTCYDTYGPVDKDIVFEGRQKDMLASNYSDAYVHHLLIAYSLLLFSSHQ